jgi:uridine phosphorylase
MPIHVEKAVIEPRKGNHEEEIPPLGILAFMPQDVDHFIHWLPRCDRRSHKIYLTNVYTGIYEGTSIALAGPMLGSPQAVLVLEKLIALGVKNVVAIGWCGSLQPHIRIGDLVLPTGSISEEGTSGHYPISLERPGPAETLLQALRKAYERASLRLFEGKIWTTDAPYRETAEKVLTYQKQDVMAVDMEVSALFTVAHFRKIQLAAVLVVSDELFDLRWRHGFRNKRFQEVRKKLPELTIQSLCSQNG